MGYTTEFNGSFAVTPALKPEHKAYLERFAKTRRMKRDSVKAELLPDPLRLAVGLSVGLEGGYYVGDDDHAQDFGQARDGSVADGNRPPTNQPGLWCQWVPNENGDCIEWDGGEKFYEYVEWLKYLIQHFLQPWGYVLTGKCKWQGEESDDRGIITVKDNKVTTRRVPGGDWLAS